MKLVTYGQILMNSPTADMRAVQKVSAHFEYLENLLHGLDVT
jgi:hypothetical protein